MSAPSDLFPESSPRLPWLPDETIFSLCSRLHRLWGHANAGRTAEILFGARRAGLQHDFPNRLEQFWRRTDGIYGCVPELAAGRTLLSFYRPFLPASSVEAAVETMGSESVAHLKFRLGLLTSRFRANHPLKACTDCMDADLAKYGWRYWHLAHQYPGVWACAEHGTFLRESNIKATGVGRFQWHLPDKGALVALPSQATDVSLRRVARLSAIVSALIASYSPPGALQLEVIHPTLLDRAASQGWLTAGGRLRMRSAADHYLQYCEPLLPWPELAALPQDAKAASDQLGLIFHPSSCAVHPLRLMLAIDWLFGGVEDFLAARASKPHADVRDEGPHKPSSPVSLAAREEVKAKVLQLIRAGATVSAAAAQVGVAVVTAMAWAASVGVMPQRRPKTLSAHAIEGLVGELREGADKKMLAQRYGISIETVTRVLRTEPGLQTLWHQARFEYARTRAREAWSKVCAQGEGVGVKLLRAQEPAAYAWLYRNDRAWLRDRTPPNVAHRGVPRKGAVRWDERDSVLSVAVQKAALELHGDSTPKQLRLWQIYQAVPELKAKLRSLSRLPLTQRALEVALAPPAWTGDDLFG